VVLNITDGQAEYAQDVVKRLRDAGLRVDTDLRNEKIGYKIREHTMLRVPYLLVVGDREMAGDGVAVRTREGEDLGTLSTDSFVEHARNRVKARN